MVLHFIAILIRYKSMRSTRGVPVTPNRHGGKCTYRAIEAEQKAWKNACRPKPVYSNPKMSLNK